MKRTDTSSKPLPWRWFDDLLTTKTEEEKCAAWRELTKPGILSLACKQAIRENDPNYLESAWQIASDPTFLRFAEYFYKNDPSTQGLAIDSRRIYRSITGTVASALTARAASCGDLKGIVRWIQDACSAWTGHKPEMGLLAPAPSSSFATYPNHESLTTESTKDWQPLGILDQHFDLLSGLSSNPWQVAQARDSVRELLDGPREPTRTIQLPVIGYRTSSGFVDMLHVEMVPYGTGECIPSPTMAWTPMDRDFLKALYFAWNEAKRLASHAIPDGFDFRWWVTQTDSPLTGGSMGVPLGVAFTQLLRKALVDVTCALTGALDEAGNVLPVQHVEEKVKAAFASTESISRVIVPSKNQDEAIRAASNKRREPATAVQTASTLEEACMHASGLLQELHAYFKVVEKLPDRPDDRPIYFGTRLPTELYVEPNVFKTQRHKEIDEAKTDHSTTAASTHLEDEPLIEDQLFREREKLVEQTLSWNDACKELDRPASRAVVVGDAGQGKSLLTQMTAHQLAKTEREKLEQQQTSLDTVLLPIVVTLKSLVSGSLPDEKTLRKQLTLALTKETNCSSRVASYLSEHAHEERCWLIVDALDEASKLPGLDQFFTLLTRHRWQCRVIITSRDSGFQQHRFPFDVSIYHLSDFDHGQVREFVEGWQKKADPEPNELGLLPFLSKNDSLRQVSQSPFLLMLACWVSERHSLDEEITRTQLYDRMVRDILGLPLRGRDAVDDQRAAEWLPFLAEVALILYREQATRRTLPVEDLLHLFAASSRRPLPRVGAQNHNPHQQATLLLDELRQNRLLVPLDAGRSQYVFPHRSLHEFLCGYALADEINWPETDATSTWEFVNRMVWHPDWENVLTFFAGKLRNPAPFFAMLMDQQDDLSRQRLKLAVLAMGEIERGRESKLGEWIHRICSTAFSCRWGYKMSGMEEALASSERMYPILAKMNGLVECAEIGVTSIQEKAMPLLTLLPQLLNDSHWKVRYAATEIVSAMGTKAATKETWRALERQLKDSDWRVQFATRETLKALRVSESTSTVDCVVPSTPVGFHTVRRTREKETLCAKRTEKQDRLPQPPGKQDASEVQSWESVRENRRSLGSIAARKLQSLAVLSNHEDARVRSLVTEAMGSSVGTASPLVLQQLCCLLKDPDWKMRTIALDVVKAFGASTATVEILQRLALLLQDTVSQVRSKASEAVSAIGATAGTSEFLGNLVYLLEHSDESVRYLAAKIVGALGEISPPKEIVQQLPLLLKDPHWRVRLATVKAVGVLEKRAITDQVLQELAGLLQDIDESIRLATIETIQRLGTTAATDQIVRELSLLLNESDFRLRSAAANALGALGRAVSSGDLLHQLALLLKDSDWRVQSAATGSVIALGSRSVTSGLLRDLAFLLESADEDVKYVTAKTLGALGSKAATKEIVHRLALLLSDSAWKVRFVAVKTLGALGSKAATEEALPQLALLLRDSDSSVRSKAEETVRGLDPNAATPNFLRQLALLLRDSDENVRFISTIVLSHMLSQSKQRLFESDTPGQWIVKSVEELTGSLPT